MRSPPCCALLAAAVLAGAPAPAAATTIVDLQGARTGESVALPHAQQAAGSITLTNLNPAVNAWFLVSVQSPERREALVYHLESADPQRQRLALDTAHPGQLRITVDGALRTCALWPGDGLERARRTGLPYAPLCEGRLYLRNPTRGNRSTLEATTEFLRDHVWQGEQIVGFVRREFYRDAFAQRAQPASSAFPSPPPGAPPSARLAAAPRAVTAGALGIALSPEGQPLVVGQWAAAAGLAGVYVSAALPGAVAGSPPRGAEPDLLESEALVLLVAFDLADFDLGFALGTEHPRLGWSPRVRDELRDPSLAGPDGIASAAPLVRTGMLGPTLQPRAVVAFAGGFKREHSAFRYGALAMVNHGSHYGFIEQGVVFSALQPGLATLYVTGDGVVGMKTWRREDDRLLAPLRHARQNGVPLLERGPAGEAVPGSLIDRWGAGNWSGSADEKMRTLRAGTCLLERGGRRFLVYGYFSTATPRTMARVFQAYGCAYAMHLDMNALEHTYFALYLRSGSRITVEHLVQGMEALDKRVGDELVPRFLGFADDRDFFYLLSRRVGQ